MCTGGAAGVYEDYGYPLYHASNGDQDWASAPAALLVMAREFLHAFCKYCIQQAKYAFGFGEEPDN